MNTCDILVLGTGPAGGKIAAGLAHAGRDVIVADRPVGGTCALHGCNPKKVMVAQAELVARCRGLEGHGISSPPGLDWADLERFTRSFTEPVTEATTKGLRKAGARVIDGHGRFTRPGTVRVGDTDVDAEFVVVAVGARPAPLPFPGAEHVMISDDFFTLRTLPRRIAFIGGGFVAAELAGVARTCGAETVVLQRGPRLLPGFDPDLADRLADLMRDGGIDVRVGHEVTGIERDGDGYLVHARDGDGGTSLRCDLVVHGAGRRPALDGLDLDAGGVTHGPRGIAVDSESRSTSNPHVLAAGDCADTDLAPLTPAAEHQARLVLDTLLRDGRRRPQTPVLPGVAFTWPPLARVGMLEAEARDGGTAVRVSAGETDRWAAVRKAGGPGGGYKVIIDEKTDMILGAHLLGPGAEETINLFALVMAARMPASDLKGMPFTFPTFASGVGNML